MAAQGGDKWDLLRKMWEWIGGNRSVRGFNFNENKG